MQNLPFRLFRLFLSCSFCVWSVSAAPVPVVAVVSSANAPPLERRAADLLAGYLNRLFPVRAKVVLEPPGGSRSLAFLVGSPTTNPAISGVAFGAANPQTVRLLTLQGNRQMVVGGGSPAATMWAVSELAEHWGVRFTLSDDLLPPRRRAFTMPVLDLTRTPVFPVRTWRVVNDFAYAMESWGINDYRPLLEQLAKLRFNRLLVSVYPWQPFLDLESNGIRRRTAALWYGYRYPITSDMIGRGLFDSRDQFWNPDLPLNAPYAELAEAGQTLIRNIMSQAKALGMEIALTATLTDYPEEFAPLLPGSKRIHQLGAMDIVPGPNIAPDHEALGDLAASVVTTSLRTYPDIDFLAVVMPEHRDWVDQYDRAFDALDARYRIGEVVNRDALLEAARRRRDYPGGAERAVNEVKGDLAALYFCDLLFRDRRVIERSTNRNVRVLYSNIAEELYPALARILPPQSEMISFIDYTPERILRRPGALRHVPVRVPTTLYYTFQDDNIGLLPQLTTGSLSQLAAEQQRNGWAGFVSRHFLTREAEPSALWAARMSWEPNWSPRQAFDDYARSLCGTECAPNLEAAFQELEQATSVLEWHGLGFCFPIPGMMTKQWTREPFPVELNEASGSWQRALVHLERARAASTARGRKTIDWWTARVRFGIDYLEATREARLGGAAEAAGDSEGARKHARASYALSRRAIEAWAAVAGDRSDLGAIALLNEYVERPLRKKLHDLGDLK